MSAFERWYLRSAPPERLAMLRILVGAFAFVYAVIRVPDLWTYSDFSASRFRPVGITGLLDGPLSPSVWHGLLLLTVLLNAAFLVGWRYKVVAPLTAVVLLFVTTYHDSFGQLFHTENLMVLYVVVLAVVPAADALSLDRRRADARGTAVPAAGPQYGWPAVLMSVLCVVTYMLAGWAKVANGGWGWVHGDVLRNQIAFDNVRKGVLGDPYSGVGVFLVRHGWVFGPIAIAALVIELGAPVALLGKRWRNAWVIGAWLFHAGTVMVMYITFPFPLSLVAFAPFFEVEQIPLWLSRTIGGWRTRRSALARTGG
ncbi:MAG TPA: HTTM domain-containing protein [Acidimicrobiales bacterium]|nr:HTTM domain-containing protein [Acidimicrobiales bacterium]